MTGVEGCQRRFLRTVKFDASRASPDWGMYCAARFEIVEVMLIVWEHTTRVLNGVGQGRLTKVENMGGLDGHKVAFLVANRGSSKSS